LGDPAFELDRVEGPAVEDLRGARDISGAHLDGADVDPEPRGNIAAAVPAHIGWLVHLRTSARGCCRLRYTVRECANSGNAQKADTFASKHLEQKLEIIK
jgi:hypothetical protein